MLVVALGNKGSGKSYLLMRFGLQSKREVFSNFRIDIPNYKPLDVIDFIELPNNIDVLIDEAYTWLESRTSGFFLNRFLSYILWQSRKRTIDIYLSAQRFRSLDLRFRDEADVLIKCKPREHLESDDFVYTFLWVADNKRAKFRIPYNEAKKYFANYDTFEIVEPYTKEEFLNKLLEKFPEKRWAKAVKIAKELKEEFKGNEFTHDIVYGLMSKHGYSRDLKPLVYVYLKGLVSE